MNSKEITHFLLKRLWSCLGKRLEDNLFAFLCHVYARVFLKKDI